MKFIICIAVAFLVGCANSKDNGASNSAANEASDAQAEKSLFSEWVSEATGRPVDLTRVSLNQPNDIYFQLVTTVCRCALYLNGDETSGDYKIVQCQYSSGANPNAQCTNTFAQEGTYRKSRSKLEICDGPGSCEPYK